MSTPDTGRPAPRDPGVYDLGADLLEAAEEMVAVEHGEREPAIERVFDGPVLVEVREHGVPVWRLADVRLDVSDSAPDFPALRRALRQSQEGMAALLGVSLATVRNWDQGRRAPRGPASQLLRVAGRRPDVFLDLG